MPLSEPQKKHLRGLAHALHPIVMVGSGIDNPGKLDAIVKELEGALTAHELVKVSVRVGDRELRDDLLTQLSERTRSELVQRIGNVGVLYRPDAETPGIVLPD